jgi:hypothetical protein
MDFLEYIYYESLPYVYAALSAFAFYNHESSKLVGLAGIVLAFCSYQVLARRYNYRMFTSRPKIKPRI